MADDKRGREQQARNEENRQRQRDVIDALERADETEPPTAAAELDHLEADLRTVSFPATGSALTEAVGDREIDSADGTYAVADLVPETDVDTFEEPADVRVRVQRPTIAAAMKRIVEVSESHATEGLPGSQREGYEETLRALRAIDAADDDEGIQQITDWIVDRIESSAELPGSRAVRRQAATFCRAEGYQIRNDEWLGV